MDSITVPGATIKTLHHAFLAEYKGGIWPVDVILVAGLNDILKGATAEDAMEDIQSFQKSVLGLKRDPNREI